MLSKNSITTNLQATTPLPKAAEKVIAIQKNLGESEGSR
jgi:hypothetical protein